HVGWQKWALNQSMELETVTQAMYHARELAITRMEEEADALGADGVVGVRLEVTRNTWGQKLIEFMAIGTAVRARDAAGQYRAPSGRPFTSNLSGQDYWTLLRAGYRPVALAIGTCVYHVGYQGMGAWFKQIGQNIEMPTFTQAVYEARELSVARMQAEAQREGAEGIVGVKIDEHAHEGDSHIIEYFAQGTAILATREDHSIPAPSLVVSLSDPAPAPVVVKAAAASTSSH
ncbi:MAG: heavy metal-binding domain-containing protein, partial [Cytophagales bacterium]|nr:heavy metal-binding domain-containing protein [Armatimonadota bacterium]